MESEPAKEEGFKNLFDDLLEPEPATVRDVALWGVSADDVEDPAEASAKLTPKAKKNIAVLSRTLWLQDLDITGEAVFDLWPVSKNTSDILLKLKAGPRPAVYKIEQFLLTEEYIDLMNELEVPLTKDSQGLTAKQIAVLQTLASYADNKTLKQKLAVHKVSDFTFQSWMKQRPFADAYKKLASDGFAQIIATAEVQLANKIAMGDTKSIELGLAMTGRWDPNSKKQLDAQKVVALILDVIDRRVKDPDVRAAIGSDLQIISGKALEM